MHRELEQRVFLVTGACGDIGRALVSGLRARGAVVVASDVLGHPEGEALFDVGEVCYLPADVRLPADVDRLLAGTLERHGHIDGLVAAAGVAHWATALEVTYEQWRHVLEVNLEGAFLAAQAVGRELARSRRRGAIAFVGSWIGAAAAKGLLPYCVSKAGLDMLAQCLALEFAPHGIRVNVVAPGVVDAGVSAQIFRDVPERRQAMEDVIPLGSLGRPEQVADAVGYLLSDAAEYVTGTTLIVDGGIRLAHAGGLAAKNDRSKQGEQSPVSVKSKIRVGVAGAPRGRSFLDGLAAYGDRAEIRAVYEPDQAAREKFAAASGVATPASYEDLLAAVDAVILASPQHHHAPQATLALDAGVHVLSEVPAAVSLEQAQGLLAAVRRSSAHYMIAENYCFSPANLTIKEMVRAGMFGELYFGEGEYLHEMKSWHTDPNGRPTWRYHWQVGRAGITYPTHSLGPLLWWFQDRVVAVSCSGTGRHTDPEHEIDDTVLMLARTAHGALLKIRLDLLSNRPHLMNYYSLQGTAGAYEASRIPGTPDHVHLVEQSPGEQWEPLEAYVEKFLPDRYREVAAGAGHGGTDTWPVRDFLDAVADDRVPELDVYAALDMTLPGLVSESSFYEHGTWRAVPNPHLWSAGVGPEPGREYPLA